eukprot:5265-Heterococcus_DN1.PRE.26
MYFELQQLKCSPIGKASYAQVVDGIRVPVFKCSITLTSAYKAQCKQDIHKLMAEILTVVQSVAGINSVKLYGDLAVHFCAPKIMQQNQHATLKLKLIAVIRKWDELIHADDFVIHTLQRLILDKLEDRSYERSAFIHYATLKGAVDSFRVQEIRELMESNSDEVFCTPKIAVINRFSLCLQMSMDIQSARLDTKGLLKRDGHFEDYTWAPCHLCTLFTLSTNLHTHSLIDFWTRLPQATIDDDGFLKLPAGTSFLGIEALGGSLYVRDCYKGLADCLNDKTSGDIRRVIITGTPGIGKSCYALYWLYLLCQSNKTVIYQRYSDYYYFSGSDVFQSRYEHIYDSGYFEQRDVWFLCDPDARPYQNCQGITLVFISPDRERYKYFLKAHATIYFMPVWSVEELQFVRSHLFTNLSEEHVKLLFLRWGGVPRYVLEYAEDLQQQALLDEALLRCLSAGVGAVISNAGEVSGSTDTLSDKIIHITTEDFISKQLMWASEYVFERFLKEQSNLLHRELRAFMRASVNIPSLAGIRGILFEPYVHNLMKSGGTFSSRLLTDDTNSNTTEILQWTFACHGEVRFDRLKSILTVETEQYYCPTVTNLAAADAFVVLGDELVIFQVTVSLQHPVRMKDITDIFECVQNSGVQIQQCTLVFLVPTSSFHEFKAQQFHTVNGTVARNTPQHISSCQQWVVQLSL